MTIDLITERRDIYKSLTESAENQWIIGIAAPDLGQGIYLTVVRDILIKQEEILITLNSYDLSGCFLEKTSIPFGRITGVIQFRTVFRNPFLKQLEHPARGVADQDNSSPDYIY